ncbi:MAG: prolyl-tRNA synthetase [Candidatus Zambryskibacteria bacterium RIFCSPLOWO2_12_FULL_39_45]|uniref:Proline--tRNA ligase n=2 Tax=Candidatus Zambryskiibacteriota TaxID=1817925 RepID=A0A1G2TBA7_9BACT|nr:MAG: prolyl-tRNA synthetase [Candidatus Zambryskibacteria bacterium RIFCSPHIGHO2_02_38_10.5]OHA97227.1 MAG: prolyl-tRNA synthetase [Candidatus Zambryskibacteria bacterium RIFCSPHIGHO2_12_FULL_38_37]OHB07390.1 MAG: prolyl-tRNA synthetase [Candidatus Zambryskibacteria bacterium RIFCSPLOWO2_02_39_10]OHB13152.1 MAG: prolyl-tRNA synthetase [Candidatus Zambryskibacteria bacterium RIFCSPLOWO2_12_FULL_39_45]
MRQSQLFTKTRKEAPSDEVSKNAQLLIRAGFIHKEMAGVYDYLPLGLRVINNLRKIIGEEMQSIGSQEVSLSTLQDPEIWKATDRWDDEKVDVWFKTKLKNDTELGLGCTHEEPMVKMMKDHVNSYRDLPRYTHQFQTKFRNELRAKSGIMRGREFFMKDMYSFNKTQEDLDEFYEKVIVAYKNVYNRAGIGDKTYLTFASGGMFSKFSHEFQTICDAGEDHIYIDKEKNMAVNDEVMQDQILQNLGLIRENLVEAKSIEVGNIFKYGTRYTSELGLVFKDEDGSEKTVVLGAYGIGLGRLMGTIVELLSDDKGIIWPKEVSPFTVHLVRLGENSTVVSAADNLYADLIKRGVEVLYDDRDLRPGEKFADSDLIGIPVRFVVSEKTIAENKVEVKYRTETDSKLISKEEALNLI